MAELFEEQMRFDESTRMSWLWAGLFGPFYFAFHGFWGYAAVALACWAFLLTLPINFFLAYPAWRGRALTKALAARAERERQAERERAEAIQLATLEAIRGLGTSGRSGA
ncbi:MAG: hypothetical protein Q8K20_12125 [Gemmobacter sp.]|nr:hypothetical protein [Gemmobacter sp.]